MGSIHADTKTMSHLPSVAQLGRTPLPYTARCRHSSGEFVGTMHSVRWSQSVGQLKG